MKEERAKEIAKKSLKFIFEDLEIYDPFYKMKKDICKAWSLQAFGITPKEFDELFEEE